MNKKYAVENDIINLDWLPIPKRRDHEYHLLELAHKPVPNPQWPPYLPLEYYVPSRTLRSPDGTQLVVPLTTGTFHYSCVKIFNHLPKRY